jgi:HEPN domain-containing protein
LELYHTYRADLIEYWFNSSGDDARAMQHFFERGDYTWALFLGHIVLEMPAR